MIVLKDLRINPKGRGSVAREELRRAISHLETVIIRSARVLCETGAVGYDLSVVEAFALLRKRETSLQLVEMASDTLCSMSMIRAAGNERITELLKDVVHVSNEFDALCVRHHMAMTKA